MDVWDLAGQSNSRLLWNLYIKQTNCIIFVIDSSDRKRLDIVKSELDSLLNNDDLALIPFCFLLNKQDLEHKMTEKEIIEGLELTEIKNRDWQLFKTVGKTGEGIDLAFKWIARQYNDNELDVKDNDKINIIPQEEHDKHHEDNKLLDDEIDTKIINLKSN